MFLNVKPLFASVLIQKRLKKEKRNKRRLQEALEEEVKLRDQAEHTLLHTASTHTGANTENKVLYMMFHTSVQQAEMKHSHKLTTNRPSVVSSPPHGGRDPGRGRERP